MTIVPGTTQSIAYIIASIFGVYATYWILKKLTPWYQAYKNKKMTDEIAEAKKEASSDNQKANTESDKLKEIDGR